MKKIKRTGWILFIGGIVLNAFPHIWWLVDMTQTLNTISHSTFELSTLTLIFVGFLMICGGKGR